MAQRDDNRHDLHGMSLVVGMGATGLSCAQFLARQGATFAITDQQRHPATLEQVSRLLPASRIMTGGFERRAFLDCQRLIVSPGVPLDTPEIAAARAQGIEIIGDIELFARHARRPVIAITGSNGKSTVTALLTEMARCAGVKAAMGGNIGIPALDLLQDAATELYVLELSSFQLETTSSLDAVAAVVLNLSPDHLDRHPDMDSYLQAKLRVYAGHGVMVVNRDEPAMRGHISPGRSVISFGLQPPPGPDDFGLVDGDDGAQLVRGDQRLMAARALPIKGRHNAANVLAALALGSAAGLSLQGMLEGLQGFRGLPHRMAFVAEHNGVQWFNDSKGTNVGATAAALAGLDGWVVLIAGGLGKGADFSLLRTALSGKGRAAVLIGRDAALIAQAIDGVVPVVHASDMRDAVARAATLAQRGDTVLLSPACASFDMFSGYADRGETYVREVRRLLAC
ncbi:MAG: UDP-N-acetylmuramoyl-L-alanine--D-glutamate ligase [Gammaproteobacteria bacterium]|nr:UDP-N-acetylmuramoyl-L-alanine--D-glutamate ligase [Gammaproteobacteria bacterium]